MYNWEIHNLINTYNGLLPSTEYLRICNTSPQLNHIKYDPYEDIFELWSIDGDYFRFKVYYKG